MPGLRSSARKIALELSRSLFNRPLWVNNPVRFGPRKERLESIYRARSLRMTHRCVWQHRGAHRLPHSIEKGVAVSGPTATTWPDKAKRCSVSGHRVPSTKMDRLTATRRRLPRNAVASGLPLKDGKWSTASLLIESVSLLIGA